MKRTFGFNSMRKPTVVPEHFAGTFQAEAKEESDRHSKRRMTNSDHIHITRSISIRGQVTVTESEYEVAEFNEETALNENEMQELLEGAKRIVALHFIRVMDLKAEIPRDIIALIRKGAHVQNMPAKRPSHRELMSLSEIRSYHHTESFRWLRQLLPIIFRVSDSASTPSTEQIIHEAYHNLWKYFLDEDQARCWEVAEGQAREPDYRLDLSTIEEHTEPDASSFPVAPAQSEAGFISAHGRLRKLETATLRWGEDKERRMRTSLPNTQTTESLLLPSHEHEGKRSHGSLPVKDPLAEMTSFRKDDDAGSIVNKSPDDDELMIRPCAPTPSRWTRSDIRNSTRVSNAFSDPGEDHMSIDGSTMAFGLPSTSFEFEQPVWLNHASTAPWIQDGSRSKERKRSLRRKSEPVVESFVRDKVRSSMRARKRVSFASAEDHSCSFNDLVSKYDEISKEAESPLPETDTATPQETQQISEKTDSITAHSTSCLRDLHVSPVREKTELKKTEDTSTRRPAEFDQYAVTNPETFAPGSLDQHTPRLTPSPPSATGYSYSETIAAKKTPARSVTRTRVPATPTPRPQRIYDLDVRYQPNLFGTPRMHAKTPAQVRQLAKIAEDRVEGYANVVTTQEDGRLFVRFKMSAEHAYLFPSAQGDDETSHFTDPPSVHGTPLPHGFNDCAIQQSQDIIGSSNEHPSPHPRNDEAEKGYKTRSLWAETPNPVTENSLPSFRDFSIERATPTIPDLSIVGANYLTHLSEPRNTSSHLATPSNVAPLNSPCPAGKPSTSPVRQVTFANDNEDKTFPGSDFDSPTCQIYEEVKLFTPSKIKGEQSQFLDAPRSADESDSALSNLSNTPSLVELRRCDAEREENGSDAQVAIRDQVAVLTPPPANATNISFTPVNPAMASTRTANEGAATTEPPTNPSFRRSQQEDDDRAYMMDFVNQSRRRRGPKKAMSTSETGSPLATASTRQPLGAKSPNTSSPSPQKTSRKDGAANAHWLPEKHNDTSQRKRKYEETEVPQTGLTGGSPQITKDTPQKVRRVGRAFVSPRCEEDAADELSRDPETKVVCTEDRSTMRRSNRTRKPTVVQSSIPKAIKLGRASSVLKSAHSDQPDWVSQTRANTRKNKGNANFPIETLNRLSQSKGEDAEGENAEMEEAGAQPKGGNGKTVAWKTPLASYQEEQAAKKPKRGRPPVKGKKQMTIGQSLGMVANGTPAKPKRVTRASTRLAKK